MNNLDQDPASHDPPFIKAGKGHEQSWEVLGSFHIAHVSGATVQDSRWCLFIVNGVAISFVVRFSFLYHWSSPLKSPASSAPGPDPPSVFWLAQVYVKA